MGMRTVLKRKNLKTKAALLPELATACFTRDGYRCRHCGDSNGIHPHHVLFKGKGGKDALNNLLSLCYQCHSAVHDGKLDITVVSLLEKDLVVRFTRKGGWIPK
jgi:5-methylcytosine-specific restriction endonuclease McrA